MALTLTNSIDATQREFAVTGTVPLDLQPGYRFRLGDELLELQGFVQPRNTVQIDRGLWYVRRGLDLSTAASHASTTGIKGAADAFVSGSDQDEPANPFAGATTFSGDASDIPLASEVAGASDVQGALEGLARYIKAVDLGVIDIPTVYASGPQTLYVMQSGEFLSTVRFTDTDFVAPDTLLGVAPFGIGTVKSFRWWGFANAQSGGFYYDTIGGYENFYAYGPDLGMPNTNAMILSAAAAGNIQAAIFQSGGGGGNGWRIGAVTAWQAATAYEALVEVPDLNAGGPALAVIVENGTMWSNTGAAGTSGGSTPDFAGNAGGTVADGADIIWTDSNTAMPTMGSFRVVAEIWTPVAP